MTERYAKLKVVEAFRKIVELQKAKDYRKQPALPKNSLQ